MKLNREAVQQRIEEIGDCGCGADKAYLSCPCMNERDEILAEFDRLTAENEKLSTKVAELDGREFDADEVDQCNDCGEWIKPPPCPECQGTKYINRVVSVTDWEWHRYYMIVDCLNCSGAKG